MSSTAQYSIDDIAYNYQADGNIIVAPLPEISIGNDAFCLAPGVCVAANVYRANGNSNNFTVVKAYLNNKAMAGLLANSFQQTVANMSFTTFFHTPPFIGIRPKNGVMLPITVSGMRGLITKVTMTLWGWTSVNPSQSQQADFVLVSPQGQTCALLNATGGGLFVGYDQTNVNIVFDDAAAGALPLNPLATGPLQSGTWQPSAASGLFQMGTPPVGPQAPFPPYGLLLSSFIGFNPNGTWMLFGAAETQTVGADFTIQGWGLTIKSA